MSGRLGAPYPPVLDPHRRPAPVTAAGTITIVSSVLAFTLAAPSAVVRIALWEKYRASDRGVGSIAGHVLVGPFAYDVLMLVLALVAIVWAVAAVGLGVAVLRGSRRARTLLMASACATAPYCLLVLWLQGFPLLAIPGVLAVVVAVLLGTREAREWDPAGG